MVPRPAVEPALVPRPAARRVARERRLTRAFFLLLLVVYTTVYPYIGSVNNPNENVRVYLTMAIVEEGTFRIDKILERHGYVNDMAKAPDPVTKEPHLYSIKAPAVSLLGVPFYWTMTRIAPRLGHPVPTNDSPPEVRARWFAATVFVLRLFVLQLPCLAFLVAYERWLRRVSADVVLRLCTVAAVGLGTNFLAYALMFVSHTFFGITAFSSFALIARERLLSRGNPRRRRPGIAFFAGLLAGAATLSEYQAFPVSCALALFALTTFWRPTRLVAFVGGAAIDAAMLMFYQWRCYDNPLTPGHKMAENPAFAAWHQQGFFGLGAPSWETFRELSFSKTFGFFGTSPFMWLGLLAIPFGLLVAGRAPGLPRLRRQRRLETAAWVLAMLALWIPISCAVNWRGGWTLGPRFFGAAPAFFGFGALGALEQLAGRSRVRRALARATAGGLAVASVVTLGFTGLVYNTFPESVTRPLLQVAWPLARLGFVPHHAAELVGWNSITFWYLAAGALLVATLLAATWPQREGVGVYAGRLIVMVLVAAIGLHPALTPPSEEEEEAATSPEAHASDLRFFATSWEPAGRDRITKLREEAERFGPRAPCLWLRLADLDRMVHLDLEAARDEARAGGGKRTDCKTPPF